jgi:hypothetical protein
MLLCCASLVASCHVCQTGVKCRWPRSISWSYKLDAVWHVLLQYDSPVVGRGESCGGFRIGPSPVCAAGLYCKVCALHADLH